MVKRLEKKLSYLGHVIYSDREEALFCTTINLTILKCRSIELLIPFAAMANASFHMSSMEVNHGNSKGDHQMDPTIQMQ